MTALIDHVEGETVKTKGERKSMQGERCVGDQGWRVHLHAGDLTLALRAVSSTASLEEHGGAFHPH